MNEEDAKRFCKAVIECGNKPLTWEQKEFLKQAIDAAQSWEQLATTLIMYLGC